MVCVASAKSNRSSHDRDIARGIRFRFLEARDVRLTSCFPLRSLEGCDMLIVNLEFAVRGG